MFSIIFNTMFNVVFNGVYNSFISVENWFNELEWYFQDLLFFGIIGIVILVIYLFSKYKWFKGIVFHLVIIAENTIIGHKKGSERFSYVASEIHKFVPINLKWFLTEKRIAEIIEWAVRKMKRYLEENNDG